MRVSVMTSWWMAVGLAVSLSACKQGDGDRCEINSDCSSGLCDISSNNSYNGTCISNSSGGGGSAGGGAAGSGVTTGGQGGTPAQDAATDAADAAAAND